MGRHYLPHISAEEFFGLDEKVRWVLGMIVKINSVIGLQEHQIRDRREECSIFLFGLPGFLLGQFPVGDIQCNAALANDLGTAIKDGTQMVLDPSDAAVLC